MGLWFRHWWLGSNRSQYYTNRLVIVQDGLLKIKTKKFQGNYTSARILTKINFRSKHGRVIRAKLAFGCWNLVCFMDVRSNISTAGWPACGEVDIGTCWQQPKQGSWILAFSRDVQEIHLIQVRLWSTSTGIVSCLFDDWSATSIKFTLLVSYFIPL
jgi:hypothetical protein